MARVNLNYGAWMRVARTFTGQHGLSLKWVSEDKIKEVGAQAWTDGKSIFTRKPSPLWDEQALKLWLYYLIHEIGHNRPGRRDMFKVLQKYAPTGLLAYVNNLLEDHVQERVMQEEEAVLKQHVSVGRAAYYDFLLEEHARDPEVAERTIANPQAPTLFSWEAEHRGEFQWHTRGYAGRMIQPVEHLPEVQEWLAKLQAGDYADVLRDKPDVWGVFELAKRIVAEVFDNDPDEQHDASGNGGNGEPGQGEGSEQGSGQGEGNPGEEAGQGGASEAEAQGSGEAAQGDAQENYADWLLNHTHAEDRRAGSKNKAGTPGAGKTIDYEKYFATRGTVAYNGFLPNFEGLKVYDALDSPPSHGYVFHYPGPESSTLSRRVARLLQARTQNRKLYGQKSGTLSNRSLYRLKMKGVGELRKRVFHQRIINQSKNVAITVAVDLSGSMGSKGKAEAAIASVAHLHEVISRQLHIPMEIVGYSEEEGGGYKRTHRGCHVIFQQFGKPRTNEQVVEGLRKCMNFNGCNRDGEVLMWLRDRLLQQKAQRHILLVISDGQPRTSEHTDVAGFTKDVIEQIERDPRMELYAIGLVTSAVRHFYKHFRIIDNVAELEGALLNVLKDKILNEVTA